MMTYDDCCMRLAYWMPRRLVYWAAVRLVVYATAKPYSAQDVVKLTAADALRRWRGYE